MAHVNVRFFAAAREVFGARERSLDAQDIDALVTQLLADADDQARIVVSRSSFLVNAVARTDRTQPLSEGDTVDILPPFAGG